MSRFFSVDSSWYLTGCFFLTATELFMTAVSFFLWLPHPSSLQRWARRCSYGNLVSWFPCWFPCWSCRFCLGSSGKWQHWRWMKASMRSHLPPSPNAEWGRSAWGLVCRRARAPAWVPHCACLWSVMQYVASCGSPSECTAFPLVPLSSVRCSWREDGRRHRLWVDS